MRAAFAGAERGFTLLEISIVLALIAVVVGGGLMTFTASLQSSQFNTTVTRMDNIEKALLNFAITNNRIPCPSDLLQPTTSATYGLEAGAATGSSPGTGTGVCSGSSMSPQATFIASSGTAEGGVPTRALRLSDDYMYDGWGRRFRYAVDPSFTLRGALPVQAGNETCPNTSPITVDDANGVTRTTAGIYALISHGANGHGAYTSNGTTMSAGSYSANELTNCHCTNAGAYTGTYTPTYVEKTPQYDSGQTGNAQYYFDDIVTFKEGWQMQAQNFPLTPTPTKQTGVPTGIAAPDLNGSPPANLGGVLFSNSGGSFSFLPLSNMSPYVPSTGGGMGFYWSPDNRYLGVSVGGGNPGYYSMYSVGGQTITQIPNALSGLPAATPYGTGGMGWSPDNQLLAVSNWNGSGPYTNLYQRCGSKFVLLNVAAFSSGAASIGGSCCYTWTPDSQWLIQYEYWWAGIYQRTANNTFNMVPITNLFPGGIQGGGPMTFSSNGVYAIEAGTATSTSTPFYVYKKSGSVYNSLTTITIPISSISQYAWSPNSNYIAFSGIWGNSPPYLYVVTRTGDGFAMTPGPLTIPTNSIGLVTVGWSPDSQYLGAAGYDYTWDENGIVLFQVNSSGTFTELPPITPPTGYTGYAHGFWISFSN